MATETVSAFTPVTLSFNKDTLNGYALKCENDLNFDEVHHEHTTVADINSPIAQSYYKRMSEIAGRELLSARERDQIQEIQRIEELKRQESVKQDNVKTEFNSSETSNGDSTPNHLEKQEEDPNNGKKKRNAKKRNRSDMPPEELMRLRERERKAQQSRRDRIRAQKRHAQGWHDDDAAWEAFLDQAENNNLDHHTDDLKPNFVSTLPPSMVCSISSRSSPKEEMFENDISPAELNLVVREMKDEIKEEEEEHLVNGNNNVKKVIQKQDSVHSNDTDTNSAGSYLDNQSVHYSSDDKPNDGTLNDEPKENGKKKLSRRHYLPSDELERLRKRERETKRRQRERHRLANTDSTSPVKSNSTLSSNDTEYIEEMVESDMRSTDKKYETMLNSEQFRSIDQHIPTPDNSAIPLVVPPKPLLTSSESHLVAVTPHSHHMASNHHRHYPSLVYMSNSSHHHHHFSHSPTQYLREGRHHPDSHYSRYLIDDRHHHSEPYKVDGYHKNHGLPHVIPVGHRPPTSADGMSSPEQKSKLSSSTSPTNSSNEKKKLISRNVDRKKLSEEELEELRRRERDYQRERRARIRLEKAKSQANHEQYSQKSRDDGLSHYYHHQSPVYRPHSALHMYPDDLHHRDRDKPIHVIPNCDADDRFDYRQYSPHRPKSVHDRKELGVAIPSSDIRNERKHNSDDSKDNDLLQVVPKTRECEEMSTSPPQVSPNKNSISPESGDSKKSVLENICSTLKKETDEWNDGSGSYYDDNDENDINDDKLVIVHPNTSQDRDENEAKRSDESNSVTNGHKEESMNGTVTSSIPSSKSSDDMSLRDRIMEDQLERRRRSNREAQRRRRARLKIQESSEERPDSSDEVIDYEMLRASKSMHLYNDDKLSNHVIPKGCRLKITPPLRTDSLYSEDYHSYHGHHNGKLPYNNHAYERYSGHGHVPSPHQVEKHCYYSSHRSSKEIDSHRYPHYFREQSKIERYIHDLPVHYGHRGNSAHIHDYNDRKKCARVPSIDNYDHHDDIYRSEIQRNVDRPPSTSNSPTKLNTPKLEIENEMEPSKQCGRKRKQQAPRKVVSSSNTPEDGDVDVCTVGESPEDKTIFKETHGEETSDKILLLNGEDDYENISSQQSLDDMHYLYR